MTANGETGVPPDPLPEAADKSGADVSDKADPAALQAVLDACLAFLQNSRDADAALQVSLYLAAEGEPISDSLHERMLRALVERDPSRLDLIRTLVWLVMKDGRSLLPDLQAAPGEPPPPIADLASPLGAADNVLDRCAAAWRLILMHSESGRGHAELARALALNGDWVNFRLAAERALAAADASEGDTAGALLEALALAAEQGQLGRLDWSDWFFALAEALQTSPHGAGLLVCSGHPQASATIPSMLAQSGGSDPKALLVAAMEAFDRAEFAEATAHIRHAFEIDLPFTLRQIIMNYPSQAAWSIHEAGATKDLTAWLEENAGETVDYTLMPFSHAPESLNTARCMRQEALDKGLPSPVLVAEAKSASVSVGNILASGFGLPTAVYSLINLSIVRPWLDEYLKGGACFVTHLHSSPSIIAALENSAAPRVIVHMRDLRQLVVSQMEHHRRYPGQLSRQRRQAYEGDEQTAIDYTIETVLPILVASLKGWLDARDRLPIAFTTFEQFVTNRERFVERLLELYGGDVRHFNRQAASSEHAGIDYHRRSGLIDEWRSRLSPSQVERINSAMPPESWEVFGWTP